MRLILNQALLLTVVADITAIRTHTPRFMLILFMIAAILLVACGRDRGPLRAERPHATSTPGENLSNASTQRPATGGSGLNAPVVGIATPAPQIDVGSLSTEEQIHLVTMPTRDLRALSLRLRPNIDEIPLVVQEGGRAYEIGDRLDFWVHNSQSNSNSQITAELIYRTDVAYAWVEINQNYDLDKLSASIDRFSEIAYPAEKAFFGDEASPGIDNDTRLHILHSVGTGSGVAGYFSSADQYSRLANPFSNEKEMFYINLRWLNGLRSYEAYETVLAHEFQHMVHWANDRNEETWINEGFSEFAQEVADYPPDITFVRSFSRQPDTQLNTWNEVTGGNSEHYGSAYLFVAYFAQRFGPEMTRALVAHPANGTKGVSVTLAESGLDLQFEDVFADWIVANYIDDPNALGFDGVYGYHKFEHPAPHLEQELDSYPVEPVETNVNNYATDYILLKGEGDMVINFEGQSKTRLANTTAYSGHYSWWSNRGDDSDSHLTHRFDFTGLTAGTPIEMSAAMWWEIEIDYDYGYVLASLDGRKWDILEGQNTTLENPSGNSFGAAYTGKSVDAEDENLDTQSAGWITERFDLTAYAGEEVYVRFEYITDDAVNSSGWLVDDIEIPAIGYAIDFEQGTGDWDSEGWLLTDNRLSQRWLLQVLELEENLLTEVRRIPVNADGRATFDVENLGNGRTAVLTISALAPVATEPATYSYWIERE